MVQNSYISLKFLTYNFIWNKSSLITENKFWYRLVQGIIHQLPAKLHCKAESSFSSGIKQKL